MRKIMSLVLVMAMAFMLTSSNKRFTIYMIGDSTMADKNMKKAPEERGWGMVLQGFFTENVKIDNHAINGRSSKSFINEGRWQKVLDKMQPGDYLVIQFGHNDEKRTDSLRYTRPWQEFADNYRMFIRAAKEKGVTPIVMNCVARRNFFNAKTKEEIDDEALRSVNRDKYNGNEKVNSDTLVDTHGDYARVPQQIAKEFNVPYIDANKISTDLENSLGVEGSRDLHMIKYNGKDNTHYNLTGALTAARLCAQLMKEKGILADDIVIPTELSIAPASVDMGEGYLGKTAMKELTLSGVLRGYGKVGILSTGTLAVILSIGALPGMLSACCGSDLRKALSIFSVCDKRAVCSSLRAD